MNILSITMDANSSACAMKDGKIVAAISEERFNKVKNYIGYPKESVEYCLKQLGGKVDKVLLPSSQSDPEAVITHWTRRNVEERMREQNEYWYPKILTLYGSVSRICRLRPISSRSGMEKNRFYRL